MAATPVFLSTLLSSFGLTLLVAGLFGAYFGKGRSRAVGFLLALVASGLIALFAALTWPLLPGLEPIFDQEQVVAAMAAVLAAMLGAAAAVFLFVASVMRS